MKKTLLLMSLGAFICSASVSAAPHKNAGKEPSKLEEARKFVKKVNARNAESQEVWRPATKTNFYWNNWGDPQGWEQQYTYKCTYNPQGLILEEWSEDGGFKNNYEYDDEGRLVKFTNSYLSGEEYVIQNIRSFEYDSVVKDLIIYTGEEYPDWNMSYGHGIEITRNELGNITNVKGYSMYNGETDYNGENLIVEYGDDNIASTIIQEYTYQDWETEEWITEISAALSDIVWENTDGQIFEINLGEIDMYDDDAMPLEANRIKECKVVDGEWPGATCNYTAEYDGLSYHALLAFAESGEKIEEITYTSLDEYGSFKATTISADYDDDEEGNIVFDGSAEEILSHVVDSFGNIIEELNTSKYYDAEGTLEDEYSTNMKGEVEYDEAYGYPLVYTTYFQYSGDEDYIPQDRIVYSDYINVAETVGVQDIENASDNAPVEFYNLNGMRVANPTEGIFIRRQGNKTSKVVIR